MKDLFKTYRLIERKFPDGNIDWAYLWGDYKDCGHGVQFVRNKNQD